ncbi:MAG: hypothetical protein Q4C47_01685 [Planctomycetia bacterium]|nr:hypothetical protein [Planctomycetia bacterium]
MEQAYFFRALRERIQEGYASQIAIRLLIQEILVTTKLPMAMDFLAVELVHRGELAPAMATLSHYFTGFQTFIIREAERDEGRFDMRVALEVLEREAEYRAKGASVQGIFLYQLEVICRNRLGYDAGLAAVRMDPIFNDDWREWINVVREQIGFVDVADLIYIRSEYCWKRHGPQGKPAIFGEREGRIAWATRHRDPVFLFSALSRQLGYPLAPRTRLPEQQEYRIQALEARIQQLETRIKLVEEEKKGGIDLSKYYVKPE